LFDVFVINTGWTDYHYISEWIQRIQYLGPEMGAK